ncbi:MAG: signal peptidase II [Lachnospiraceae bacterium]|nr:signal peptidase II [Lachnospiraceae bacterium]
MLKEKKKLYILDILLLLVLVFLDQAAKYAAVRYLKDKTAIVLIDGVLELNYLENKGAAFGMLQNQKFFFIFVAVIFLGVMCFVLYRTPADRKYTKLHILLIFISAGAIGNMIDRLRLDYVVDFIYFSLINFPIFNVADVYVTVSTFILVFLILFVFRDNDFYFLSFKEQRYREMR